MVTTVIGEDEIEKVVVELVTSSVVSTVVSSVVVVTSG